MQPLDTSVKGSPGTLGASADFLDRYAQGLDGTGQDMNTVNNTREADWHGPASEACGDALADIDSGDVDQLKDNIRKVARAERDFQHALNAVVKQMQDAINTATAAGLTLNGPLIMPPTPPGPAPQAPMGPFPLDKAQGVADAHKANMAAYQGVCDDYNRKLAAYNQAKAIIDKARTDELNAHNTLDQAVAKCSVTVRDLKTVGNQAITWAATYVKTFHGTAEDLFNKADDALKTGKIYESFNAGGLITLTAEEKSLINWGQTHAQGLSDQYNKKAGQLEKFVARVPTALRKGITANPEALMKDAKYLKWSKPLLKEMPYVGTAIGAGANIYDAVSGEKSWGRAGADFGAETVGGAVGGWAGGALVGAVAGSEVPVVGTVIGGVVGGFLGTAAADKAVDYIANPQQANQQARESFKQYDFGSSSYQYPG